MNKKNLSVVLIVAIAAVAVGYFTFVKKSEIVKDSQQPSEVEKPFVLIGKRPTPPNANFYRGYVIVEGQYGVDYTDSIVGGGTLYFSIDEQYRSKLPKRDDDYPLSFYFDNESSAKQMLNIHDGDKAICLVSGKARIAIENYTTELLESEVFDHTTLAKVLSHTSPTMQKCSENKTQTPDKPAGANWQTYYNSKYGYSIGFPITTNGEVNSTVDNINLGDGANISIFAHVKNNDPVTDEFEKPELYQYVSVIIGGNNAFQKKGYGTANAFFKEILFYGSQYNYKIVFSDEHDNSVKIDLADQIIATFKFTK